jgi:hypothetical protein
MPLVDMTVVSYSAQRGNNGDRYAVIGTRIVRSVGNAWGRILSVVARVVRHDVTAGTGSIQGCIRRIHNKPRLQYHPYLSCSICARFPTLSWVARSCLQLLALVSQGHM